MELDPLRPCQQSASRLIVPHLRLQTCPVRFSNIRRIGEDGIHRSYTNASLQWREKIPLQPDNLVANSMSVRVPLCNLYCIVRAIQRKNSHAVEDGRQRHSHTTGTCSDIHQHGTLRESALPHRFLNKKLCFWTRDQHSRSHREVESTKLLRPQDILERLSRLPPAHHRHHTCELLRRYRPFCPTG